MLSAQTFSCDSPESRGRQVWGGGGGPGLAEARGRTAAWLFQPWGDVPGVPAELSPGTRGGEAACNGGSYEGGKVSELCLHLLLLCRGKRGKKMGFSGAVCGTRSISAGAGWAAPLPGGGRICLTLVRLPGGLKNSDFSLWPWREAEQSRVPVSGIVRGGGWGFPGRCYAAIKASGHQTGRWLEAMA